MTIPESSSNRIHVAVGVITNNQKQVLISKRHEHLHQGGLWEFPGGKIEQGESSESALRRELVEELDIEIKKYRPLITIPHDYNDKQVCLDVFNVTAFTGRPKSCDRQELLWVDICDLKNFSFPAANKSIISALQLAECYVITGAIESSEQCKNKVQSAVAQGLGLIQLRQKELSDTDYLALANDLLKITRNSDSKLILNCSLDLFIKTNADGIHYTGQRLRDCRQRPLANDKFFSVSTHTLEELQHAVDVGADFAMLSPVLATQSHPGEPELGWEHFGDIVKQIPIPVYALGGMSISHLAVARQHGAQGIAAISALWNDL